MFLIRAVPFQAGSRRRFAASYRRLRSFPGASVLVVLESAGTLFPAKLSVRPASPVPGSGLFTADAVRSPRRLGEVGVWSERRAGLEEHIWRSSSP